MNRRPVIIIGGLLALGFVLGWLSSDVDVPEVSDNDAWQSFETSLVKSRSVRTEAEAIKSSGLIREFLTAAEKAAAEAQQVVEDEGVPPLPKVISTSIIDGQPKVHIKQDEGRPISKVAGEALDSGWVIKTVNLNTIVFQYGDLEKSIALTNYDLSEKAPGDAVNNNNQGE